MGSSQENAEQLYEELRNKVLKPCMGKLGNIVAETLFPTLVSYIVSYIGFAMFPRVGKH